MATAGLFNGNLLGIYIGGVLVTHALQHSENHSVAMIDVTTKDSAGDEEVLPGVRGSELSASGYFAEDATYGYEDFFDAKEAGTLLTVLVSSAVTGDVTYTYTAYITSLSRTAEHDTSVPYEVSLKPTAATTKGSVA